MLGLLVSDDVLGAEGEELEIAVLDISRAHFMAPMDREACIELPQGDRQASAIWMRDWQATIEQGGYKIGVANPALFYNAEERCRGGVHGDDIVAVGSRRALDRMGKTLSGKYFLRESHRLGFWNHCERHAELLNRIVCWDEF